MPAPPRVPPVPAVLRLVQMMVLGRWRATGEELYREVADLVDAGSGKEIVVSGSGEGETSEWLAAKSLEEAVANPVKGQTLPRRD